MTSRGDSCPTKIEGLETRGGQQRARLRNEGFQTPACCFAVYRILHYGTRARELGDSPSTRRENERREEGCRYTPRLPKRLRNSERRQVGQEGKDLRCEIRREQPAPPSGNARHPPLEFPHCEAQGRQVRTEEVESLK